MKELDTVKLLNDFEGIKAGTIGVIVCEYDGTASKVKAYYLTGGAPAIFEELTLYIIIRTPK